MSPLLSMVVCMACISWLLLLVASLIRARAWTPAGLRLAMGNREQMPEPSALAGRAERTARNTLESFVIFAALALAAQASGLQSPHILLGAQIFFYARLAFIVTYYLGIPYLRTLVWTAGSAGLALMAFSLA